MLAQTDPIIKSVDTTPFYGHPHEANARSYLQPLNKRAWHDPKRDSFLAMVGADVRPDRGGAWPNDGWGYHRRTDLTLIYVWRLNDRFRHIEHMLAELNAAQNRQQQVERIKRDRVSKKTRRRR